PLAGILEAERPEGLTDDGGHRGRVRAPGVAPRADGPDGLVGDREPGVRARRIDAVQRALDLGPDDLVRATRLALRELLADAQDHPQAVLVRAGHLAADQGVRLARVPPALAVARDHPRREAEQHRSADLARVRPARLVMHVLRAH